MKQNINFALHDEIAQTLLSINVRLLALKQAARSNSQGLKNAIAGTQRLVLRSATAVRRFTRELEAATANRQSIPRPDQRQPVVG